MAQNAELQPSCHDLDVPAEGCNHAGPSTSAWYWLAFGEGRVHAGSTLSPAPRWAPHLLLSMEEGGGHNHATLGCFLLRTVGLRGFSDVFGSLPGEGVSQWHVPQSPVERGTPVKLLDDCHHARIRPLPNARG